MFFPNRIANTIDRLLKTNQEFNKYSTAYNKKDEIELSSNSLLSIAMSKHRNKTKDNKLNQNNKTTCIFKHNRVLRNPQRKRNITDITNSFTIHEPQLKFVRRYSKDIDNLLNSKKEMSKTMTTENNTLSNVDLYRNCMKIITNKKKIQSIADEIVYYVKQDNKNKKKNEIKIPTSYNNYFDIVINNVMKKVTFYTSTNEEITTEKVMNLLLSEADILKEDTDNYMKKYCQIKNFSTFIELNDKEKQFLPLINSTRPFTKTEISNKEKQKQDNKLHSQFKGVFNDFQLNAKLNRIDENVARTKRKKHKVKKIGANGEIYYEEVSYTDTNEESQKGEDGGNDIIGGLGQGSIWDTYNKVQNKKTKPKENNNKEEIDQKDDDKNQYDKKGNNATNLTPNKNLVLNQKNLTNSSKRIKLIKNINEDILDQINSNDNDKQNNNENSQINNNISNDPEETQLMQYYPKSKKRGKHTDNKINLVTLSTHEDSYINSFSKRKKKDDTNSNILSETKDDLMSLFGKNNNKKIEAQKNSEKRKKIKEKIILKDKQYKSSIEEYNENNNNSKDNVNNNENNNNGNSINEVNNRNSNNNHNHRVMNNQKIINLKQKELHDKIKSPKKKKNKKGNHKDNKEKENDNTNNTFPLNNNENQALNEGEKTNEILNENKFANSEMINNINGELFNSDSESKTEESLIIINNGDNIEDVNNNRNGNNNSINGKAKKRKKHKKKNKGENNTNEQSNQSQIENKDNSMSNSNNIDKDVINQENKTNNQNNQTNKQNQQGNNKSKFVRKKEEESTNELPQKVENVFFDDPSESGTPFNNSKQNHSLLKINFNGPKKILKKFSSSKMNNYYKPKYPDENEKLLAENEKKLTEEKKNQILSRLNNAIQRDFSQLSNETKIKDINIIEKIKYEMLNETSEEGRERYLEMINQINLLKQSDVSAYISELEREYEPFQEEIESIVKSRKIEERLNRFLQFFGDYRKKQINKRIILSDKIKVVDSKFITTMSDKLYSL